ncbi:hypothetical protein DAPPUDRAFT_327811 [Daphnia pulex]|uniref:Uncharacterized protein n=1 Tax=Daphnia pulex TaxID=6669 RepID=E9HBV6_DAPPU|nr:hypothetical protein DAPPUDRAFT_327811 [Daphnia pulex]|eukprot:EFX70805.1 hypothetical protein DAPPUDRAFT_327811 [Daphnia pulex]
MERHINDLYKHLQSHLQSVSARTKFVFLIVLRYAICKVLNVSYEQELVHSSHVVTKETERVAQSLVEGETEDLDHQFLRRQDLFQGNPVMTQETEKSGRRNRASLEKRSETYSKYSSSQERDRSRSTSNGRWNKKVLSPFKTKIGRRSSSSNKRDIVFVQHSGESKNSNLTIKDTVEAPHLNLIVFLLSKIRRKLTSSKTEVKSCFKPYSDGKTKIKKRKSLIREFVCLRKEVRKDIELQDERDMVLLDEMGLGSLDIRLDDSATSKEIEEVLG